MRIGQELQYVPMEYETKDIKIDRKKTDFFQNSKAIFDIFDDKGNFFIRTNDPTEPICRVISRRYFDNRDKEAFTYLKEGDEFRLGRLNLKVLQVNYFKIFSNYSFIILLKFEFIFLLKIYLLIFFVKKTQI